MKRSRKINMLMYTLLIEKKLDGFSVIELRDASLSVLGSTYDSTEARKKVYRQILSFERESWLRCEEVNKQKRYFQTDTFKALQRELSPRKSSKRRCIDGTSYSTLSIELQRYREELEIILAEIEEYHSLNRRFPELSQILNPLFENANRGSSSLRGRINVLATVIRTLSEST